MSEHRKPDPDVEMVEHSDGKSDEVIEATFDKSIERRYVTAFVHRYMSDNIIESYAKSTCA